MITEKNVNTAKEKRALSLKEYKTIIFGEDGCYP